jgi:hypothetical protein
MQYGIAFPRHNKKNLQFQREPNDRAVTIEQPCIARYNYTNLEQ